MLKKYEMGLILVLVVCSFCYIVYSDGFVSSNKDINQQTLIWTRIGAFGSWAGSIFGAVALIVSILAFRLPRKAKIKVFINNGIGLSLGTDHQSVNTYTIEIRNSGLKPVSVSNIYLHFGNRKQSDIYIGVLNNDTILQSYFPKFPVRIEQGESVNLFFLADKLDKAIQYYEANKSPNTPLSICVEDAVNGKKYYRTKWMLRNFIDKQK